MFCDNASQCYLIFISVLSNGTFLGLSALTGLYLSHNKIQQIHAAHLTGLERLEVLHLDHNRLQWLEGDVFALLTRLVTITLHNNLLARLDVKVSPLASSGLLQVVTLHHNNWECRAHADCQWVTRAVDTLNKSAVRQLSEVSSAG